MEFEELPAIVDLDRARESGAEVVSSELCDNICFQSKIDTGGVDAIFARAAHVVGGIPLRPAHGGDAGAARHHRRLRPQ